MTDAIDALRARMFAAMGIPIAAVAGCARTTAEPPRDHVDVAVAPTPPVALSGEGGAAPQPSPKPVTVPPGRSCGPDAVRESMCGFASGAQCPADSRSMHDTAYLRHSEYYAYLKQPFSFDAAMTEEWTSKLGKPMPRAEPYCCYSACTKLEVSAQSNVGPSRGLTAAGTRCIYMPDTKSSAPAPDAPNCPAAVVLPAYQPGQMAAFLSTQPTAEPADRRPPSWLGDRCCYRIYTSGMGVGRALRVEGEARVAHARPSADWCCAVGTKGASPPEVRARLAAHWTDVAALEHASVAAFARLSLELLAHAAPPDLVAAAHAAALDEIEHARLAFGFASAYGGAAVGPGPLDPGRLASRSLSALALETFVDGCIEESVGAEWARRAAEAALDPAVAGALRVIAEDEARHAVLAFRIVSWAAQRDAALVAKLAEALAGARATAASALEAAGREVVEAPSLEAFGVLDARATRALRAEIVARVVAPCVETIVEAAARRSVP